VQNLESWGESSHLPNHDELRRKLSTVEITKALAALQPLYGKDNVEIITLDGRRVRGTVRSMKTTQALTTPSVKIECANGEIVKIPFPSIAEIKDYN
jgi:hypothetical protein